MYELKDISFEEIQERFENYFYLPNSIKNDYDNIVGKAIHVPAKDVRGLYMTIGIDTPITVKLIVTPALSLYNQFKGNEVITGTEDGLNKIEFIQPDMGICYSLIGDMEYEELESFLKKSIPYSIETNKSNKKYDSDIVTALDKYTQNVELTDGQLFFNPCTSIEKDIAYFDPNANRIEK